MENVTVQRYDPDKKKFVDWKFKPNAPRKFYWMTADLQDDPTSVDSDDIKYKTEKCALDAGLRALSKMEEGTLEIWYEEHDAEGNGESGVLREFRREKTGPSFTKEVDPND